MICNEFWYISWDRARQWEVHPNLINDWWRDEIPSICGAQTFTEKATGRLTDLTLYIKENINGTPQLGLAVEIRLTEYKDGVCVPTILQGDHSTILVRQYAKIESGRTKEVYTVHFNQPCQVVKDKIYVFSIK